MSDVAETAELTTSPPLSRKDFVSDQMVRWCPGCGDYAILATMQRTLPELGILRENIVFISGIGCSSRFPYYMNTFGMHSIHGRAPTFATGLKLAQPDLTVFVITGDGDGLSIGGNHLLHACRRNVDLNIILFNNRIYGLTKGQYSPTSLPGHRTKSSPMGSVEQSLNPISVALAAEATFVARTIDVHVNHMADVFRASVAHVGVSFTEILQNCNIFNDGAWEDVANAKLRAEHTLELEHGKPMVFGAARDKGIRLSGMLPEVVSLETTPMDQILVHDAHLESSHLAYMLSRMNRPEFPLPLGVFRSVERPSFADALIAQTVEARAKQGPGTLRDLIHSGDIWTVGRPGAGSNGRNGHALDGG